MKTLLLILLSFNSFGQSMSDIKKQIRQNDRIMHRVEMKQMRIENMLNMTPRKRNIELISSGAEMSVFVLSLVAGHSETDHPHTNFARHWNQNFWNHQISSGVSPTVYGYHFDAFHIGNSIGRACLGMVIAKYWDRLFPTNPKYDGKLKRWLEYELLENLLYNGLTWALNR